jgi:hypothetical protein
MKGLRRKSHTVNRAACQSRPENKYLPNLETLEDRLVPAIYTVHNATQLAAAITAANAALPPHPGKVDLGAYD